MSLFIWNDTFSVNHGLMDEHHQRLVFLLNRLDEALDAARGDEVVGHGIEELVRFAAEHLKAEERLMEAVHYPATEMHRAMHRFFASEAALLRTMHAAGQTVRVRRIVQFLRDWLVYHIFNEDRKYGEYLVEVHAAAA